MVLLVCVWLGQACMAADVQDAKGYQVLRTPQSRMAGGNVEVIEFFSYTCPICFSYEPAVSDWLSRTYDRISFRRVPVGLRPDWVPAQKMYFALELMGKADVMHKKVFNAIHIEKRSIKSDEAVIELIAFLGLNRKRFSEAYYSQDVQEKVHQALQMQKAYEVEQVPMVAVDGRFLTSPAIAAAMAGNDKPLSELQAISFNIVDDLILQSQGK